jgi:hypothetical protein
MYVLYSNEDTLIVSVYVDDLIITINNNDLILILKKQLANSFDMTDLDTLYYFLGLQVLPLCDVFFISQSKYVMDLLTHFKMADCKLCATPFQYVVKLTKTCQTPSVDATLYRQLVGNIIYLTHSRPDISFIFNVVLDSCRIPEKIHWKVFKQIVHYLKGTTHFGIKYCHSLDSLVSFTNSDWVDEGDDWKSTSGYVFCYSTGPLVWSCKKHKIISLSTIKEEYRGAIQAHTEVA